MGPIERAGLILRRRMGRGLAAALPALGVAAVLTTVLMAHAAARGHSGPQHTPTRTAVGAPTFTRLRAASARGPAVAFPRTGPAHASGPARTPAPAHSPAPAARRVRYRLVGCVRSGPAVAYTHGPRRREVALSFDDGPYPLTPSFVRMLKANGAVATFFMIGEQLTARYRATLLEELRDGDALGDHTFTHPDLVRSGAVSSQLERTVAAIRGLSGYTPCVFRPPYGGYDGTVLRTAAKLGLATVMWEVDPSDYTQPGVSAIEQRVLAQVRPGSIVLSHDGGGPRGQTLAAYPSIIRALRSRGYRFVTVPELLGFRAVYRRCARDCEGMATTRPPAGAIVESG